MLRQTENSEERERDLISTSYHETVKVLQGAGHDGTSPFDRLEWLYLLEKHRPAGGGKPFIATASDDAATVALPLRKDGGRLEPLRNWYNFTWRPVWRSDAEADRLCTALARDLRRHAYRLTLWPLPEEDMTASRLAAAFRKAGWQVYMSLCDHNHILRLGDRSFAEYWADRPGRMRSTLQRKGKKVRTEIITRFSQDVWDSYETIYADSWKPAEGDPVMLKEFAEAEGRAGRLRMATAYQSEQPVAAQFWTVENGIAYIHKLAHVKAANPLSAGTTLTAALLQHVIDNDGVALVDFGTGDDAYKKDWMEDDRPRYRLDCLDPRQPRAWPALAKRAIVRVARGNARG